MSIVGTAGHVDHGKSSLIEALTGTDPDRLPEEQRRGMTIDLGFAHFPGAGAEAIGVIDVPGHEHFLRNMVAGAWSLDCALLAVPADDGCMPQSGDHTRVLNYMGVPRLILVVTKSDITGPEQVEEVRRKSLELCAGLGYPEAPSIAVSARTGENIEALRGLAIRVLEDLRTGARHDPQPGGRLPSHLYRPGLHRERRRSGGDGHIERSIPG